MAAQNARIGLVELFVNSRRLVRVALPARAVVGSVSCAHAYAYLCLARMLMRFLCISRDR